MALGRSIHPHLIARFSADCAPLWPADELLCIAVSGGADSLALLLLANAARPGAIHAATVDHGLRPESVDEAEMVARLCSEMGIPHAILNVQVGPGNLQARAREARYQALAEWMAGQGLKLLATAHQADDQAETLLMRLNRGSGVSGLAGVRAQANIPGAADLRLLRPLLGWRKQELAELVQNAGIDAVQDPSNQDQQFDRVRIRQALADADWLDVTSLAQSAAHLADAQEAIEWAVEREWENCVTIRDGDLTYRPNAPRAIRLAVLIRAIAHLGAEPRGGAAARLMERLENGEGGNLGGVLAIVEKDGWMLRREPPRH